MKACPQCSTKNKENIKFCKKCGQDLSALSPAFREKKEKVTGNKSYVWLWALIIAALLASGGFFYKGYSQKAGDSRMYSSNNPVAASSPMSLAEAGPAAKGVVSMTCVKPALKDGFMQFSSADVKSKGIICTEYQKGSKNVPLTAYISHKGKLVTAIAFCEPCRSKRFHLEGKNLVCDSCNTIWTQEDHKGISGGCMKYGPAIIAHTLDGDTIKIKEADILAWKPRV